MKTEVSNTRCREQNEKRGALMTEPNMNKKSLITLISDDGTKIATITADVGSPIMDMPNPPEKKNHAIAGWYNGKLRWRKGESVVTDSEMTLKAKYKYNGPLCIVQMPIKLEKWQEDVLGKRFDTYRKIQNATIGEYKKRLAILYADPDYIKDKEALNVVAKKLSDNAEKNGKKKINKQDPEYKEAEEKLRSYNTKYGIDDSSIYNVAIKHARHFEDVISTTVVQRTISSAVWAAVRATHFYTGKEKDRPVMHYKKFDDMRTLTSDGKSGIRILDEENKTVKKMSSDKNKKYYVALTTKKGKNVIAPILIDRKNLYLLEMIENEIKEVTIARKKVKGQWRYTVQLCVAATPAIKYDKDGNEKHPVGDKKLGIFINANNLVIASEDGVEEISLRKNYEEYETRIAELNRYMDTSSRISNPDNYNEDGTIKKGIVENGKKRKLRWVRSNGYKKAKAEKANLERVMKEQRKIGNNILANNVIALGTDIIVNDYNAKEAQKRKEETTFTQKGTYASKAKAGDNIKGNAPAQLLTAIDMRLTAMGFEKMKRVSYNPENYKTKNIKDYARDLYEMHNDA